MNPFSYTLLCCTLLFLTLKELTEACSCAYSHPQQSYCSADVVFRARIISAKTIPFGGSPDGTVQYEIKLTKLYKGYVKIKDIHYVYTSSSSSVCGVTLDHMNKKEYLLTGTIVDGKVRINLCGLHILWENLTEFQRKCLADDTYERGCGCKITHCVNEVCKNGLEKNECPRIEEKMETLATQHACIKLKNGSCSWYPSLPAKTPSSGHP